jgi:hypothetical protein
MPDKYDAAELAKTYINGIITAFSSPLNINAAVKERQIIINDPSKGNRQTLSAVRDQFDPDTGNQKADALFTLHNPDRVAGERNRYLSPEMSEWEKIAFAAVYFKAGSDMTAANLNNPMAMRCIDAIQVIIANELRTVAGFTHPRGYELNEFATAQLTNFLKTEKLNSIAQEATITAEFTAKLQTISAPFAERRKEILGRAKIKTLTHWTRQIGKN